MINQDIINSINYNFSFLEKNGYDLKNEYYKSDSSPNIKYDYAVVYADLKNNLKFSVIYYNCNPNLIEKTKDFAIQIILFKNNEHIDFSRLLNKDPDFTNNCSYQYFIFPYKNEVDKNIVLNDFLHRISDLLNKKYLDLINGKMWIDIKYDLRDDY